MRGKYIAIEGGEGAGKSTLCAFLKQELGCSAELVREPGSTPFAEDMRDLLFSEAGKYATYQAQLLGMYAARVDVLERVVKRHLNYGKHVIADRCFFSSYAYQVGGAHQAPYPEGVLQFFWDTHKLCVPKSLYPDMVIWLDIDPSAGLERVRARGGKMTRFDQKELAFHERVRDGYCSIAKLMDVQFPVKRIDASRPVDYVQKEALRLAQSVIG